MIWRDILGRGDKYWMSNIGRGFTIPQWLGGGRIVDFFHQDDGRSPFTWDEKAVVFIPGHYWGGRPDICGGGKYDKEDPDIPGIPPPEGEGPLMAHHKILIVSGGQQATVEGSVPVLFSSTATIPSVKEAKELARQIWEVLGLNKRRELRIALANNRSIGSLGAELLRRAGLFTCPPQMKGGGI